MKRGPKKVPWEIRFFKYVEKQTDGHWLWIGRTDRSGQTPVFSPSKNEMSMSCRTLSYFMHHGHRPKNNLSAGCGEKMCVNPKHLVDTVDVYKERDREIIAKMGKYIALREEYRRMKKYNVCGLAKEYGLTRQRIEQIVSKHEPIPTARNQEEQVK